MSKGVISAVILFVVLSAFGIAMALGIAFIASVVGVVGAAVVVILIMLTWGQWASKNPPPPRDWDA